MQCTSTKRMDTDTHASTTTKAGYIPILKPLDIITHRPTYNIDPPSCNNLRVTAPKINSLIKIVIKVSRNIQLPRCRLSSRLKPTLISSIETIGHAARTVPITILRAITEFVKSTQDTAGQTARGPRTRIVRCRSSSCVPHA